MASFKLSQVMSPAFGSGLPRGSRMGIAMSPYGLAWPTNTKCRIGCLQFAVSPSTSCFSVLTSGFISAAPGCSIEDVVLAVQKRIAPTIWRKHVVAVVGCCLLDQLVPRPAVSVVDDDDIAGFQREIEGQVFDSLAATLDVNAAVGEHDLEPPRLQDVLEKIAERPAVARSNLAAVFEIGHRATGRYGTGTIGGGRYSTATTWSVGSTSIHWSNTSNGSPVARKPPSSGSKPFS